jgi:DNA-binding transcriptional MocR family regulator
MSKTAATRYEDAGPLASLFASAEARVLDQSLIVGNMEQTISMLSDSTGLSFKTVQKVVKEFVDKGFLLPTRRIGNAQAYSFQVENHLHDLVGWATKYQFSRPSSRSKKKSLR